MQIRSLGSGKTVHILCIMFIGDKVFLVIFKYVIVIIKKLEMLNVVLNIIAC